MSAHLFSITMGTGLALAVDQNNQGLGGQLILASLDAHSRFQQWSWLYMPSQQASLLYCPHLDLIAAPTSINKGSGIVLQAMSVSPSDSNTFQITSGNGGAIRPPADTDLNMNALGDSWSAGTKVALWSWSGGKANEVWTSSLIS